jgi:hypothetical protein
MNERPCFGTDTASLFSFARVKKLLPANQPPSCKTFDFAKASASQGGHTIR